jgi:hypothetical protein
MSETTTVYLNGIIPVSSGKVATHVNHNYNWNGDFEIVTNLYLKKKFVAEINCLKEEPTSDGQKCPSLHSTVIINGCQLF